MTEKNNNTEKQCDIHDVIHCAKCHKRELGYGLYGEICKGCDHLMRLTLM